MSVLLPAGNGTISRNGRSGQAASPLCASAALAAIMQANATLNSRKQSGIEPHSLSVGRGRYSWNRGSR